MLTFIQHIVPVGFLDISYHIPCITCQFMEVNEGEYLSHVLVYPLEHIPNQGGMCMIKVTFPKGWGSFQVSKVW